MKDHGIVLAHDNGYVADMYALETERPISHDYLIDRNGDVKIRINGDLLEDLVTEPLFRNTFNTFNCKA